MVVLSMETVPKMNLNAVSMLTCAQGKRNSTCENIKRCSLSCFTRLQQYFTALLYEIRKYSLFYYCFFSSVPFYIFASKPQAIILKHQNESYVITKLHRNSREESVVKCIDYNNFFLFSSKKKKMGGEMNNSYIY